MTILPILLLALSPNLLKLRALQKQLVQLVKRCETIQLQLSLLVTESLHLLENFMVFLAKLTRNAKN
jgi:hypothetical protein